ncbi:uncharacterized protein LOC126739341 [Anthonomus grandis grandis]|uniref:uncharacterized protein LOC126739341 n=1 Tax=Anthonomus grandis grandis TaxID=2921223 RepID=UPI0021668083|nr:uncharacterized protein LOC126739341 [Anthonomus grandis grandis]
MPVNCFECDKPFSNRSALNRHMRNVHKLEPKSIEYEESVGRYKCREGCRVSFRFSSELRLHLTSHHSFSGFKGENMSFNSHEDFEAWLYMEKESKNVDFVKSRGSVRYHDCDGNIIEKTYFDCNRSGIIKIKTESDRKRNLKRQGSAKINQGCLSQIIVKQNMTTMECNVKYYSDHYYHDNQIEHVRLSDRCRKEIASKLMSGVPASSILDEVKQDFPSKLSRDYMVSRQDIYNINTSFHISKQDAIEHKKGKLTRHINLIHVRHRAALTMTNYTIQYQNEDVINLSDLEHNEYYTIIRKKSSSCCQLCCKYCHICIHMYECSCDDFSIRAVICKHIHFFCLNCTEIEISEQQSDDEKIVTTDLDPSSSIDRDEEPDLRMAIKTSALQIISNVKKYNFSYDQQCFILRNLRILSTMKPVNSIATRICDSPSSEKSNDFGLMEESSDEETETKTIKALSNQAWQTSPEMQHDHDYID